MRQVLRTSCFGFCQIHTDCSPLGSVQVFIRMDEQCKVLCKIDSLPAEQAKAFKAKIEDDYRVNMCALYGSLWAIQI